ncbi:hypothetical protein D3C86_1309460 [compost metagenome]
MAFFVEHKAGAAGPGQEARELVGRYRDGHGQRRQADQAGDPAGRGRGRPGLPAAPRRRRAHQGGKHRQDAQAAHESQRGHQHKASQQGAGDAPQGVARQHRAGVAPYPLVARRNAQHCGKRRAQQKRRRQHEAGRRHGETGAHAGECAAGPLKNRGFRIGLRDDQPFAQHRDFQDSNQSRPGDQSAKHGPGVAHPVRNARIQRRADRQPHQVGGQHDGKGKGPRAHEGHDHLRPDHFIAQRDAARHGVQRHSQAGFGG